MENSSWVSSIPMSREKKFIYYTMCGTRNGMRILSAFGDFLIKQKVTAGGVGGGVFPPQMASSHNHKIKKSKSKNYLLIY